MLIDIKNSRISCKAFGKSLSIQKLVVGKAEDVERVSHNLHSVLYTYIIKEDLGKSVDFVDSLIVQGNVSSSILDHQLPTSGAGVEKPPLMTIVYNSMRMEVYCPCHLLYFCNTTKYMYL